MRELLQLTDKMTNYGPRKLRWQCTKLKEFNLYFCQLVIFMHILVRFIDLYTYDSHTMVRFGLRLFMRLRFWFFFFTRRTWTQLLVGTVHCARYPHHFQRPHIGPTTTLLVGPVYYLQNSQISFFNNFFIKNGCRDTIHTFKNYFTTVFSVFNFRNNKFNPNEPNVDLLQTCI